ITVQKKAIKEIKKSCNINLYGLRESKLKDLIESNLGLNEWNPEILEKLTSSFILTCQIQTLIYPYLNITIINYQNFYDLFVSPEIIKTYQCFKLGKEASILLESIILRKKFSKFTMNDSIDVYEFFYFKKILSENLKKDFKNYLSNRIAYKKEMIDTILAHNPLTYEQTRRFVEDQHCYWFRSYDNFKILWMYIS
ncbi:high molecular weight rhoptry protein 2, putative, partial [Hepatocystis sp. ex Piliocolobus tephrosceles]